MGFFDTVKGKAGALAADAERAGKVTAAQARLVVLQNDLKKAERELGHAAYALAERGDLDHPDLTHAIERLRGTTAEVRAKEAEIAALRGEAAPAETTTGRRRRHGDAAAPDAPSPQRPRRAARRRPRRDGHRSGHGDPVRGHGRRGRGGRDWRPRPRPAEPAPEPAAATPRAGRQEAGQEARGAQDRGQAGAAAKKAPADKTVAKADAEEDGPPGPAPPPRSRRGRRRTGRARRARSGRPAPERPRRRPDNVNRPRGGPRPGRLVPCRGPRRLHDRPGQHPRRHLAHRHRRPPERAGRRRRLRVL